MTTYKISIESFKKWCAYVLNNTAKNESDIDFMKQFTSNVIIKIPSSYEDHHSIANEWAIYRWAKLLNASDDGIERIEKNINQNLYFKYLKAAYPIKSSDEAVNLKIENSKNKKVLYIDDEADKGWYEIYCNILYDKNQIDFNYLDLDTFKDRSREEIINATIKNVEEYDPEIVILDFRLHPDDFGGTKIENVTGYNILKQIKKINPGIQVIIFSATNKVWNLEKLNAAGADGFIIKESPENSVNPNFTKESIQNFVDAMSLAVKKSFLKVMFTDFEEVQQYLLQKKNDKIISKDFYGEVLRWLKLSNLVFKNRKTTDDEILSSFMLKFSVIETIANFKIDLEPKKDSQGNNYFLFKNPEAKLYNFEKGKPKNIFSSNKTNIPWSIKIQNTFYFINKDEFDYKIVEGLVEKRNSLVHLDITQKKKLEITIDDILTINRIVKNGLINL
ncbi:response regulator [Ornithobacterium rhinotracheale]|uniref:response regulator n=1 Tax=Ornithobacterium rhinotracheale TaxID=28251 RepID=UPI00129D13D1|nr:response regulator [Ornithobacterium rhinotracheale]MRJ08580.1 response regulator [Ornithobacterium rhinotracheale]UOH76973.1 response regulator [Ornithobacterium rhinotracheale]